MEVTEIQNDPPNLGYVRNMQLQHDFEGLKRCCEQNFDVPDEVITEIEELMSTDPDQAKQQIAFWLRKIEFMQDLVAFTMRRRFDQAISSVLADENSFDPGPYSSLHMPAMRYSCYQRDVIEDFTPDQIIADIQERLDALHRLFEESSLRPEAVEACIENLPTVGDRISFLDQLEGVQRDLEENIRESSIDNVIALAGGPRARLVSDNVHSLLRMNEKLAA